MTQSNCIHIRRLPTLIGPCRMKTTVRNRVETSNSRNPGSAVPIGAIRRRYNRWGLHFGEHVLCRSRHDRGDFSEGDGDYSDDWDDFDSVAVAEVIGGASKSSTETDARDRQKDESVAEMTTTSADAFEPRNHSSAADEVLNSSHAYDVNSDTAGAEVRPTISQGVSASTDGEPDMSLMWQMGLGGVAALIGLAGIGFLGHKAWKSQGPKVQKAMEARQLARESQQRLGEFMSQLRNQSTADLSAKNLGDEGKNRFV